MNVRQLAVGPLEANCFLVDDGLGGPLVVIDPGGDAEVVIDALAGRDVAAVILTHGHFDHLAAAAEVIAATGAPLLVHEHDAERITHGGQDGTMGRTFGIHEVAPYADRLLKDGDEVRAGGLTLTVLHTPGHTAGGICLFSGDVGTQAPHLFSGDTLFAGSVGRTDFPGGDSRALARSIAEKLSGLPAGTIVHPGHGPNTSIARESRINPFWPRA